jgi:hypothetical protein
LFKEQNTYLLFDVLEDELYQEATFSILSRPSFCLTLVIIVKYLMTTLLT